MFSVAFAAISLFSTSCQKRDLNSIAGGSNEKGVDSPKDADSKLGVNSINTVNGLFAAESYQTLIGYSYNVSNRNYTNLSTLNASSIVFGSSVLYNPNVSGVIASDGTNFYGVNLDGKVYSYPVTTSANQPPTSSNSLVYASQTFVPDEIEYCNGKVYAIDNSLKLFAINNISTSTPNVSLVGDLFTTSFKGDTKKCMYNKFSNNTLHLVTAEVSTGTIRLFNINLTTGVATLTNTYVGAASLTSNSNISAYYANNEVYVYVQDFSPNNTLTNYTLYKINSSNVFSTVTSSNGVRIGDFCFF